MICPNACERSDFHEVLYSQHESVTVIGYHAWGPSVSLQQQRVPSCDRIPYPLLPIMSAETGPY